MDGMSMMPSNGGGGGGGERPKRPSGEGHPAVVVPDEDGNPTTAVIAQPMPVVLTVGTIIKLASVIIVPMLGALSAGIYFVHKVNAHVDDPVIHLTRGERSKLETKSEAKTERKKLETSIKREVKLQARELKQDLAAEQKVQIKKLSNELKRDQRVRFNQILDEVKKARRDIKSR